MDGAREEEDSIPVSVKRSARPRIAKEKPPRRKPAPIERGTLSPEVILRAALQVADRDGLSGLTIRKLAAQLGASPMGVYRHFRNKEEIVERLVDLVVGDYDVTNHEEPNWNDWLRQTFRLMHKGLCEHPGITPLLGKAAFLGTNASRVIEEVLAVLLEAGFGEAEAALLFYTLIGYTIGASSFKDATGYQTNIDLSLALEEQLRQKRLSFEMAPLATSPTIVALAPHLAQYSTDEQFQAGLERVLLAFTKGLA